MTGAALAAAAESLIGCRFRLHGRDPANGLDCIGVLAAALAATGQTARFPTGYRVRTEHFALLPELARSHGFTPVEGNPQSGDVLFIRPGPGQLHLLIAATQPDTFVEAHAGLGRVVLTAGPTADPVLHQWRLCAGI